MGVVLRRTCDLPGELAAKARDYASASLAPTLARDLPQAVEDVRDLVRPARPCQSAGGPSAVSLFLADLADRCRPSTIYGYLPAIGHTHHAAGFPFNRAALDIVLQGICRSCGTAASRIATTDGRGSAARSCWLSPTVCAAYAIERCWRSALPALHARELVGRSVHLLHPAVEARSRSINPGLASVCVGPILIRLPSSRCCCAAAARVRCRHWRFGWRRPGSARDRYFPLSLPTRL